MSKYSRGRSRTSVGRDAKTFRTRTAGGRGTAVQSVSKRFEHVGVDPVPYGESSAARCASSNSRCSASKRATSLVDNVAPTPRQARMRPRQLSTLKGTARSNQNIARTRAPVAATISACWGLLPSQPAPDHAGLNLQHQGFAGERHRVALGQPAEVGGDQHASGREQSFHFGDRSHGVEVHPALARGDDVEARVGERPRFGRRDLEADVQARAWRRRAAPRLSARVRCRCR